MANSEEIYANQEVAGRMLCGMRLAIADRLLLILDQFVVLAVLHWNLFCLIHNMKKMHVYGAGFAQ